MAPRPAIRNRRLRAHVWLLARLTPWLVLTLKLSRLIDRMTPPAGKHPYAGMDPADIVQCVWSATRRPLLMRGQRCLREGLLAFYFLRLAGLPAVLHMGLEPASLREPRARGHAWVTVDGKCLLNPPSPAMTEIHRYGDDEAPRSAPLVQSEHST